MPGVPRAVFVGSVAYGLLNGVADKRENCNLHRRRGPVSSSSFVSNGQVYTIGEGCVMPLVNGSKSWVAIALVFAGGIARAEDFHVESSVYKVGDKAKKPIIETTTLFVNGVVYDFLKDPQAARDPETTIFAPQHQRFIVLDPQRKMCVEVALKDVKEFTGKVRVEAAGAKDPILNFLSNPQFTEKDDDGQLEFSSAWMIYRLKTEVAKSAEIARQYGEFSHWHCQLNVMINPQTLPPFGRMSVSEKLEKRGLLPTEVYMTISPKGPAPKLILRAEHRFQRTILEKDRQMIDEAQRQSKLFRQVTLPEYNDRLKQDAAEVTKAPTRKTASK
jgi:hypothetical protein